MAKRSSTNAILREADRKWARNVANSQPMTKREAELWEKEKGKSRYLWDIAREIEGQLVHIMDVADIYHWEQTMPLDSPHPHFLVRLGMGFRLSEISPFRYLFDKTNREPWVSTVIKRGVRGRIFYGRPGEWELRLEGTLGGLPACQTFKTLEAAFRTLCELRNPPRTKPVTFSDVFPNV